MGRRKTTSVHVRQQTLCAHYENNVCFLFFSVCCWLLWQLEVMLCCFSLCQVPVGLTPPSLKPTSTEELVCSCVHTDTRRC